MNRGAPTASERLETIRLVEGSGLSVKRTLAELGVPRSTFYRWYRSYQEGGYDGLRRRPAPRLRRVWNRIPDEHRRHVIELALAKAELSPRELAWHLTDTEGLFVSESSVYRILKSQDLITSPAFIVLQASDRFANPTRRVHELWQTDFTYFRITGWGWYFLSTVLDDFSRYIISWKLCTGMAASDVTELLEDAVAKTGVTRAAVRHRPRLLSDNGPCYISRELREYLSGQGMGHTRGKPYHPMTQGKIERYHRTLKNVVALRNYYQPGELERAIASFVEHYNKERYHESLQNLTPEDVYRGRGREILTARDRIKRETLRERKRYNQGRSPVKNAIMRPAELRESVL